MSINWKVSNADDVLIKAIAQRACAEAMKLGQYEFTEIKISLDLTATHANGCPLDLPAMLDAPYEHLMHDVFGINKYLDHDTGKLKDFTPRLALQKS